MELVKGPLEKLLDELNLTATHLKGAPVLVGSQVFKTEESDELINISNGEQKVLIASFNNKNTLVRYVGQDSQTVYNTLNALNIPRADLQNEGYRVFNRFKEASRMQTGVFFEEEAINPAFQHHLKDSLYRLDQQFKK